jgi:hypothetical protein
LFEKWTNAVIAMASSKGTNKAKAGNNKVPKPKPEKKVRVEAMKETKRIIRRGRYSFIVINFTQKYTR